MYKYPCKARIDESSTRYFEIIINEDEEANHYSTIFVPFNFPEQSVNSNVCCIMY